MHIEYPLGIAIRLGIALGVAGVFALASLIFYTNLDSWDYTPKLSPGACRATDDLHSRTITDSNGSNLCLAPTETKAFEWQLAPDRSRVAYALLSNRIILAPQPGFMGERRVPATLWFVVDSNGKNHHRFPPADNRWLMFSPDGQYGRIQGLCSFSDCQWSVFLIDSGKEICTFHTSDTFYGGNSNCKPLLLRGGTVWNIEHEIDVAGCESYRKSNMVLSNPCEWVR